MIDPNGPETSNNNYVSEPDRYWMEIFNRKIFEKMQLQNYNHFHILRLFDDWANFSFTTSETKRDY